MQVAVQWHLSSVEQKNEEFIEARLFVCVIDDDDEVSGYVPAPERETDEAMPSDLGESKVILQEPESDFSEDFEDPQLR